jgi:predicted Zn-dependent protease
MAGPISPVSPVSAGSPGRPARKADPISLLIVLAGAAAFVWALRSVPPRPPIVRFPRQPSEFRVAADLSAAKAASLAALAVRPDDASALIDLAIASFESGSGDYVKGLEYVERARDLGALDERLFYYAGVMYEAQGLSEYAVPEYEKYLRRHPEDLDTRLRLANLFYRMEELDKSIDAYRLVLASKLGDPLVSYNLAMAYRDKKSWADGLEALKPFLEGGTSLPSGGHKLLGDLYRGSGDAQRGLAEYEKELALSGESAELASGMAQADEDLHLIASAIERWQKVIQLDPNHREARIRLRRLKQPVPGRRR